MLSTTVSLYLGIDDALRNQYPRNIQVEAANITAADSDTLEKTINDKILKSNISIKNVIKYRYKNYTFNYDGNLFTFNRESTYADGDSKIVFFILLEQYNKMQGANAKLNENELMIYSPNADYKGNKILFNDITYNVKSKIDSLNVEKYFSIKLTDTYYFIVPDEQAIENIYKNLTGGNGDWKGLSYYYAFDVDGNSKTQVLLADKINEILSKTTNENTCDMLVQLECAESSKNTVLSMYGGFLFLGIFLGALFIMTTVLIMYYKQISEGYDDKGRFEIMQKVGMSRNEVKSSIRSQVLTVFFLPIIAASIHIAAAFKMITRLLEIMNLTNVTLFAWCTVGTILVFAILYSAVYALTARAYYRIVE